MFTGMGEKVGLNQPLLSNPGVPRAISIFNSLHPELPVQVEKYSYPRISLLTLKKKIVPVRFIDVSKRGKNATAYELG